MSADRKNSNHRILVIDDMPELHAVFRRLLCRPARPGADLGRLESALFGAGAAPRTQVTFEVDAALQGEAGLALVRSALAEGRPYAMAFVDMRMPPGWDGLQTIEALWREYPDLEVVICTAYADYSDNDIVARLGASDQVLFLRKPFDAIEVRQLARALTEKWTLRQQARVQMADLERRVSTRTRELSASHVRLAEQTGMAQAIDGALRQTQQFDAVGRAVAAFAGELDTSLELLNAAVTQATGAATPVDRPAAVAGAPSLVAALGVVTQATGRMTGLVRRLVKLAAQQPPPVGTIDLNGALLDVAASMREGIAACAALHTDFGQLPPIPCSPADVTLVLLGLIDSAVQAVDRVHQESGDKGRISISTRFENGQGVIAISDSGAPVPDDLRERILQPFFTARDGGRQGLGMAHTIIVDQHGGELTLENDRAGGMTVTVRLPAALRDRPAALASH